MTRWAFLRVTLDAFASEPTTRVEACYSQPGSLVNVVLVGEGRS